MARIESWKVLEAYHRQGNIMIDKLNNEYVTLVVEPEDTINGMLEKVGGGWMITNGYNETYGFKEHDVIDIDVNCKIIYLRG